MALSDTVAAMPAWPVAAALLAWVAGLEGEPLAVPGLLLLEQAAASRLTPVAATAVAI